MAGRRWEVAWRDLDMRTGWLTRALLASLLFAALGLAYPATAVRGQDPCAEFQSQVDYIESVFAQMRAFRAQASAELAAAFAYADQLEAAWAEAKVEWARYCSDPNRTGPPPEMPDLGTLPNIPDISGGGVKRPTVAAAATRAPAVTRRPTAATRPVTAAQQGPLGSAIAQSEGVPLGTGQLKLGWVLYGRTNLSEEQAEKMYRTALNERKSVLEGRKADLAGQIPAGEQRLKNVEKYLREGEQRLEPTVNMLKDQLKDAYKDRDKQREALLESVAGVIPFGSHNTAKEGTLAAKSAVEFFRNPTLENGAEVLANVTSLVSSALYPESPVGLAIGLAQLVRDVALAAPAEITARRYERAIDDITAGRQVQADRLIQGAQNQLQTRRADLAQVEGQLGQINQENRYLDPRALP